MAFLEKSLYLHCQIGCYEKQGVGEERSAEERESTDGEEDFRTGGEGGRAVVSSIISYHLDPFIFKISVK